MWQAVSWPVSSLEYKVLSLQEWYLVHRVDLHNYLKQRALQTATLHMGCKIVGIDVDSERPSVTLDNGDRFEGDLLLGADGLHVRIPAEVESRKEDTLTRAIVHRPQRDRTTATCSIPGGQILLPLAAVHR